MVYLIFPTDESTTFLYHIYCNLYRALGLEQVSLIRVHPSCQGYGEARDRISDIPDDSLVIYMGHGTSSGLFGGEFDHYPKKFLYKSSEMAVFKNMNILLLTCQSIELIKSSFRNSQFKSAIGFGALPTDLEEIKAHSKLKHYEVDQELIHEYKRFLIEIVSSSVIYTVNNGFPVNTLFFRLKLLINNKISGVVIESKNTTYADLLHYMKSDMDYF